MKKYIVLILALVMIPCMIYASDKNNKAPKIDKEVIFQSKVKTMVDKLQLSPDQVDKFVPIYREYVEKVLANRPKYVGPKSVLTRQGKIKPGIKLSQEQALNIARERISIQQHILSVQQETLEKLKYVLTPQQLLNFTHVESQMGRSVAEAWKNKGHKGHGHPDKKHVAPPVKKRD
ncbi:MAG: hypothetical protein J1F10_05670 [Muribaculaceae bacterium]|nr:hypothetical protein [Muribaculaceae bacterium]